MVDLDIILEEAYENFISEYMNLEPTEEGSRITALVIQFSETNKNFKRTLKETRKYYKHGDYNEALKSIKFAKDYLKKLQSMADNIPDNKIKSALTNLLSLGTFHVDDRGYGYVGKTKDYEYELSRNLASKSIAETRTKYKMYLNRMGRDIDRFEKDIRDKQKKSLRESNESIFETAYNML